MMMSSMMISANLRIYLSSNPSYGLSWLQQLSQMLDPRSSTHGSHHAHIYILIQNIFVLNTKYR